MHAASLEADYRASIPGPGRAATGAGDLFAELLRSHADDHEPETRPHETRPTGDRTHEAPPAREPADAPGTASPAPDDDPAAASDAAGSAANSVAEDGSRSDEDTAERPAEKTEPQVRQADSAAPVATNAAPDAPVVQQAAVPMPSATPPEGGDGAVAAAPGAAESKSGTKPTVAPTAPAAAGLLAAEATPRDGAAPVAPAPVLATATAHANQAQPATAAPPPVATSVPAPTHQATPAGPGNAAEARNGDGGPATAAGPDGTIDVQVKRAPIATTAHGNGLALGLGLGQGLGQGLGKLGSGAEVALAAQALGDAAQAARKPGAAKPAAATQPVAGSPASQAAGASNAVIPAGASHVSAPATAQANAAAAPPPAANTAPAAADAFATFAGAVAEEESGVPAPGSLAESTLRMASSTGAAAAARPHAAPPAPAAQLAVHVQRAVSEGSNRITVQLHPVELGQIEVRLEFADDGRVSATVLADRADTLDLLQRDARTLERALQDSGLKADSGSMRFDLRDFGRQGQGFQQMANQQSGDDTAPKGAPAAQASAPSAQMAQAGTTDSGVDIHV